MNQVNVCLHFFKILLSWLEGDPVPFDNTSIQCYFCECTTLPGHFFSFSFTYIHIMYTDHAKILRLIKNATNRTAFCFIPNNTGIRFVHYAVTFISNPKPIFSIFICVKLYKKNPQTKNTEVGNIHSFVSGKKCIYSFTLNH